VKVNGEKKLLLAHQIKEAMMFSLLNIIVTAIYVVNLEDIGGLISLYLKKTSLAVNPWME
jgi:hypothetical protein